MPTHKRRLRVIKLLGLVPAMAVCNRQPIQKSKVPLTVLKRTLDAQQNLKLQFDRDQSQENRPITQPTPEMIAGDLYGLRTTASERILATAAQPFVNYGEDAFRTDKEGHIVMKSR